MLFDDQEVAFPFGSARGDVAVRRDHDLGLAPQRDLAGDVLERSRVHRNAEPGRQHLAVELGSSRIIDPPRHDRDAVRPVLVGREVAGEALQRDGISEAAPPFHVEANAVGLPDLQRLERDGDRLPLGRAGDIELGQLGVVDRHGQPVSIFGKLRVSVEGRQCGQSRPLGLVRPPAGAGAVGEQPADRAFELGRLGPNASVRQAHERGRLGGARGQPAMCGRISQ